MDFVIGDTIALTPPMGFNTWNHFHRDISDAKIRAAADAMVSSGLIDHGWTYINIDDCWQGERDAAGNIQGNSDKFPDLKALGDYIHSKGLKFGLYSSPGPKTCAGFAGSFGHEDQDARTYAAWGVDYVKYDLCSYGGIIRDHTRQFLIEANLPDDADDVREPRSRRRDAACAGCPQPRAHAGAGRAAQGTLDEANQNLRGGPSTRRKRAAVPTWRSSSSIPTRVFEPVAGQGAGATSFTASASTATTRRVEVGRSRSAATPGARPATSQANWKSMSGIGFRQNELAPKYAGPGHWNDPDMLEVGNQGLTPDECYTHMTLWSMLAAPLLIGCDMTKMDPFTVSLFSNDEVLAINQDALGQQGYRLAKGRRHRKCGSSRWSDGSVAVALFNRGEAPAQVGVSGRS